jgi:membrane-associated phospholipid phosphatase
MFSWSSRSHVNAHGRHFHILMLHASLVCTVVSMALAAPPCRAQDRNDTRAPAVRPEFRWRVDAPLLGTSAALYAVSSQLHVNRILVPPQGLDPADIHWSLDRNVIGEHNSRADRDSDYFRDAAVAYPMVLAYFSQPPGARQRGTLRRAFVYAEAILVAEGLSSVIKRTDDRPRPYAYLPENQRPHDPAYDVNSEVAFRSMPSGHATISFCASAFAMTDHLITRPDASWQQRAGFAFIGGFLAGMTSGMRIEGGQHFPSDALVGGLIGTASGVSVPLLHHYIGGDGQRAALPSASAWWQAIAGQVLGISAGLALASVY